MRVAHVYDKYSLPFTDILYIYF